MIIVKTTEEYKNRDGSEPSNWKNYSGGSAYHGRGLIQLTHDKNYNRYGAAVGVKFTLANLSIVASDPDHVFHSATWYWQKGSAWGNANTYADLDDVHYITMLVNGGFNDYCGRKANLMKLLDAMQIKEKCKKVKDKAIGNYSFSTSKLANTKAGKNIWHNYHTNKKLASNVSCESK